MRVLLGPLLVSLLLWGSAADAQPLPLFGGTWESRGPGPVKFGRVEGMGPDYPVTGPVQVLVPHPTDADILWIGGVNGGIWKTTNATDANPTWVAVGDDLPSLSIGALALDPTDATHQTLVAGFGRFSSYRDNAGGPRAGVARSTDGGETWALLAAPELQGKNITSIAARGNVIVAAVDDADTPGCANVGIFRSTNTGASFTRISGGTGTGLPEGRALDLAVDPTDDASLYVIVSAGGFDVPCHDQNGVYHSTDLGGTYTAYQPEAIDPVIADADLAAAALDVDETGGLAVAIAHPDADVDLLYEAGGVVTPIDEPAIDGYGLYVAPGTDGSHPEQIGGLSIVWIFADLFAGGNRQAGPGDGATPSPNSVGANNYTGRIFRCDADATPGTQCTPLTHCQTALAGCNGQASTTSNSAPHVNSRDLAIDANGRLLVADDGGVYARANPTGVGDWVSLNGNLVLSDMHSAAWDPLTDSVFGSANTICAAEPFAGDPEGMIWSQVDYFDCGAVAVASEGSVSRRFTTSGSGTRGLPDYNQEYVHRRDFDATGLIGEDWLAFAPAVTGVRDVVPCGVPEPPQVERFVFFATDDGLVESIDNGATASLLAALAEAAGVDCTPDGSVWVASTTGANPGGANVYFRNGSTGSPAQTVATPGSAPVVDIAVDPANAQSACLINEADEVHCTANGGASWTNVTGNLFDDILTGLRAIEFLTGEVPAITVGGRGGVRRMGMSSPGSWERFGSGLPAVQIEDLEFDATDDILVAATLGRGAWTLHPASNGSILELSDVSVAEGNAGTTDAVVTVTRTAPVTRQAMAAFLYRMYDASDGAVSTGNAGPITISSAGNATPYPSTLNVTGASGTIESLTVTLSDFSHTWVSDVDVLLQGPDGKAVVLMSDVGSGTNPANITLTFDDAAAAFLPNTLPLTGTYKPTNLSDAGSDTFGAPASAPPYGATLSTFAGTDPNGEWKIFVVDDAAGDSGSVQSWKLDFVTTGGDFTAVTGTVTFPAGVATQTITIPILGDTLPEPDETFGIVFTDAVNVGLRDTELLVTILNDDALAAPGNVVATANRSGSSVAINWNAAPGASAYNVYRSANRTTWNLVGSTAGSLFTDTTAPAGGAFLYKVRATLDGAESPDSNVDHTTTTNFSSVQWDPGDPVTAAAIEKIREAANATRTLSDQLHRFFTSPAVVNGQIRASQINEARDMINEARSVFGAPYPFGEPVSFGDVVLAQQMEELFTSVR